jgi:hypothetical protein
METNAPFAVERQVAGPTVQGGFMGTPRIAVQRNTRAGGPTSRRRRRAGGPWHHVAAPALLVWPSGQR